MALDSGNVLIAGSGFIGVAAVGATAPTTATADVTATFADLGYITEDGITIASDRTTTEVRAFQNADILRNSVTGATSTFSFTMAETKAETLALYFGQAAVGGVLNVNPAKTGGRKAFVIDVSDGTKVTRYYIPEGEVTDTGDVTYTNGEVAGYEVTITAYPSSSILDADGDNAAYRVWFDIPADVPAG